MTVDPLTAWLDAARDRIGTERILRDGDAYYVTEASAWERVDLDTTEVMVAAIRDVLALHQPHRCVKAVPVFDEFDRPWRSVVECKADGHDYPCPTVHALSARLLGDGTPNEEQR